MSQDVNNRGERNRTQTRRTVLKLGIVVGTAAFGFTTVTAQDDYDEERDATLSVSDQAGDGGTMLVNEASATVDYYVDAHYDGEMVRTEEFEAETTQEHIELALDPALEEDTTIEVGVHAADDGEELVGEEIHYTAEDPVLEDEERRGELDVRDQSGDGETLIVWDVTANVDYYLTARYDGETVQTDDFQAGLIAEQYGIDLDPPIEENTFVEVSVHAAEDGEVLDADEICYRVE